MADVALTVIALALLAFIAWQQREWSAERERWSGDRERLVQRIQAPERAIADHSAKERKRPPAKPPRNLVSDDEAMAEALREREAAAGGVNNGHGD